MTRSPLGQRGEAEHQASRTRKLKEGHAELPPERAPDGRGVVAHAGNVRLAPATTGVRVEQLDEVPHRRVGRRGGR